MKIKDNLRLKIFSVVLAILLWSFVIGYENPTISTQYPNIPIVLKNIDKVEEKGLTIGGDKESTVNVTLRGQTNSFINVKSSDIKAEVDLSQYDENDKIFPIKFYIPQGLNIVDKSTATAPITLEKIKSKEIKVEVVLEGKPAADNQVIEVAANQPETIVVEGAESLIQSVEKAVAIVESSEITNETNRNIPLLVLNSAGEQVTGITQTHAYVNVTFNVNIIKKLPIELVTENKLAEGITEITKELSHSDVSVRGTPDVMSKINVIKTHPLDLSTVLADGKYSVTLNLPEGVRLTNDQVNVEVKYILDTVITKELSIDINKLEYRKKPQGVTIKTLNEQKTINLEVTGLKSKVNPINEDAIKPYVDLTGIGLGTHELDLKIDSINDVVFENINPLTIRLTITPPEGL